MNVLLKLNVMIFGLIFCVTCSALLTQAEPIDAYNVAEIVTIKTGKESTAMGNQFFYGKHAPYDKTYAGFAVDSTGIILISDLLKTRIYRVSEKGTVLPPLKNSKLDTNIPCSFWPEKVCLLDKDKIVVHDTCQEKVRIFSAREGEINDYSPGIRVFENLYRSVPIIDITCENDTISVSFGIRRPQSQLQPVYTDTYNARFVLLNRKTFEEERAYYKWRHDTQPNPSYIVKFTDSEKNYYGYPAVDDPAANFLPLSKYSPDGVLLWTMNGAY